MPIVIAMVQYALLPRYRWIVTAYSDRDGGWVRIFPGMHFKREQDAWDLLIMMIGLIQLHGDIQGFDVKKTIRF